MNLCRSQHSQSINSSRALAIVRLERRVSDSLSGALFDDVARDGCKLEVEQQLISGSGRRDDGMFGSRASGKALHMMAFTGSDSCLRKRHEITSQLSQWRNAS